MYFNCVEVKYVTSASLDCYVNQLYAFKANYNTNKVRRASSMHSECIQLVQVTIGKTLVGYGAALVNTNKVRRAGSTYYVCTQLVQVTTGKI